MREWEAAGRSPRRPFTGARIETSWRSRPARDRGRPFTGARIETAPEPAAAQAHLSPLHGGADRNPLFRLGIERRSGRPFTGARIETGDPARVYTAQQVAPSRGRGSKPQHALPLACAAGSPLHGGADRNDGFGKSNAKPVVALHGGADRNVLGLLDDEGAAVAPSRGRGSKLDANGINWIGGRRPFTGARIETAVAGPRTGLRSRRPSRGRGSKRGTENHAVFVTLSPLHGGADRNEMCLSPPAKM